MILSLYVQPQRAPMHPDEMSSEAQRSATGIGEEEEAVSAFEEAFQRIKDAIGVTDTQVRSKQSD